MLIAIAYIATLALSPHFGPYGNFSVLKMEMISKLNRLLRNELNYFQVRNECIKMKLEVSDTTEFSVIKCLLQKGLLEETLKYDDNAVEIRKFHLVSTKNTSLVITFVS